ncbi:MAG: stage II sporulation protein R [Clostridiaceae bacterium]|nr:stage II sporulation protein R [Clostridiaceae bacterium]
MYKKLVMGMLVVVLLGSFIVNNRGFEEVFEVERRGESLIRFHVLANSDDPEDQLLKLKVRDEVIAAMADDLEQSNSIEETREILKANLPKIQEVAAEEIFKNGKDFEVAVKLEEEVFPTRRYGDMVFPAGRYEALKVEIGRGTGENWWCVMFPPLCFVDVKSGLTDEKTNQAMKDNLTAEEYQLFYAASKDEELPLQLKSKIAEVFRASKHQISRLASAF